MSPPVRSTLTRGLVLYPTRKDRRTHTHRHTDRQTRAGSDSYTNNERTIVCVCACVCACVCFCSRLSAAVTVNRTCSQRRRGCVGEERLPTFQLSDSIESGLSEVLSPPLVDAARTRSPLFVLTFSRRRRMGPFAEEFAEFWAPDRRTRLSPPARVRR